MNKKSNSLQIVEEHSKNEWRYMLVLLVLGGILGILIHHSAHKAVLVSDQHAANEARDVTNSAASVSAVAPNQLVSGSTTK